MATTSMLVFRNRDCLSLFALLFVSSDTILLEVQTLLFLFFPKSAFPNWGYGLSKDAAYSGASAHEAHQRSTMGKKNW